MFKAHPDFEEPDDDAVLWRYKDIPRYLDLLLKQQLFFCRADSFEDPFEGVFTKKARQAIYKSIRKQNLDDLSKQTILAAKQEVEQLAEKYNNMRTTVTVSSWHSNRNENYAMWNIYARGTYGVAIQTTFKRLKDAFSGTDQPVFIGKVNYYNDKDDSISSRNSLGPFLRKRAIYEYENEVRCCYVIDHNAQNRLCWHDQDNRNGVFIPANLDKLIDRIYISPYSPNWIRDIIAGINEKFNLQKEIVHSSVFHVDSF